MTRVSDTFPAAGLLADLPAVPAAGGPYFYSAIDTGVVYRCTGGDADWSPWTYGAPEGDSSSDGFVPKWDDASGSFQLASEAAGTGGSGLQKIKRTTGDIAISGSTAWQDVVSAGGLDLTLAGVAAGSEIEFIPNFLVNSTGSVSFSFDVATIVSGSPVNYFGGSGGGTENGMVGWFVPATAAFFSVSGAAFYTLQAGDISSGNVTLRLRVRAGSTTSRSILASTTNPLLVAARKVT